MFLFNKFSMFFLLIHGKYNKYYILNFVNIEYSEEKIHYWVYLKDSKMISILKIEIIEYLVQLLYLHVNLNDVLMLISINLVDKNVG